MSLLSLIPLAQQAISYFTKGSEQAAEGKKLIEQMKNAKDEREAERLLVKINALVASDKGQIEINKIEAQSSSFFKSGWRPLIGWVSGLGFAYAVIVYPILTWVATVYDISSPPNLETGILVSTMMGMLGLGAYRTYEKQTGITK